MISLYDLKQSYHRHGIINNTKLSDDEKFVVNAETGKRIGSLNNLLSFMRKDMHCDFEEIYSCHGTLQSTLRCRECGTVIFASDDCDNYDPRLCCPVCAGYQTGFEYWTGEEIAKDPKKQQTIAFLEKETREQNAEYERYKQRGLWDHQRFVKKWRTAKHMFILSHICDGWGKEDVKKCRYLELEVCDKDIDGGYIVRQHYKFPINPYATYIFWVLPHTRKYRNARKELAL